MKKVVGIVLLCLTMLVMVAWAINPQLFKIVWYQKPEVDTYKSFPTRAMSPSPSPLRFTVDTSKGNKLDSVMVKNWENQYVPFSEYFEKGDLLAFLVIKNDTLVYEKYGENYNRETVSNTFSIGKTMISILTGKAIDLGYIKDTEQRVINYLPELKDVPNFDEITILDLLNMKSGLQFKRAGKGIISDLFCDEARFYYTNDLKNDLVKVKADTLPGTRWKYSNLDPLFLTWVLERAAKTKVSQLFEREIWKPIGAEYGGSWGVDQKDGLENSPSSFQCTAIDLAKIGRLYLNKGVRDTVQVLSLDWIEKSTHITMENRGNTEKGWQKATHQYYWWLPQENYEGDYSAEGLRGQRLYINPKENIIIVQFAKRGYGGYPYRAIAQHFSGDSD
ncbi:serine hydrolase [Ulvibacterium sp.]|uniref:serine hydrolase domain-containing protein n=1 Tax=Ulvibacterium sp. TaxID=2665914 RepID=UPI002628592E|nr:serine hydrolase [Ulvibacterium sp.]